MIDIMIDQGAAYKNHSPHEMSTPIVSPIKLTATKLCAAAVLIPMFQIDTACTAVMTKRAASLLSLEMLNAVIIPIKIGITAPARAVADGTKNARIIETTILPITIREVLLPTSDNMKSARRLCKFVDCIAAAKNSAAATSTSAGEEYPLNASPSAFLVPTGSAPDNSPLVKY